VEAKAREVAEPLLAAEGYELVDLEYVREREGWVLRLFIDRLDHTPGLPNPKKADAPPGSGVGIEDCTKASHAVETALDVEDFIPQEYSLEVSSPGLDRPLKKPEHFVKSLGKKVKVKTFGPLALREGEPPRKNFSGVLSEVDGEAVVVTVEGAGAFRIPMKEIAKANLEFEF
jgi:ribosome maturation factor RimP